MPRFTYSAVDIKGALVSGEVSAPDELTALDQIGQQGLTPVSVKEGGQAGPWWSREVSLTGKPPKLALSEQAGAFSMLATMLQAKFPLPRALAFCVDRTRAAKTRRILTSVSSLVASGSTLEQALAETAAFDDRIVTMVGVGERANSLETVAVEISGMLDADLATRRQIRQALVYPSVLLAMSVLVLLMIVFYLAPTLVPVFTSANVEPPPLLDVMDGLRRFILEAWPLLAIGAAIVFLIAIILRDTLAQAFARTLSRLPGIRGYLKTQRSLRFSQTMALMLSGGAKLPQALSAAAEAASDREWTQELERVRERVEAGNQLSDALETSRFLDDATKAFIRAGEDGDRLHQMLAQSAKLLSAQSAATLAQAVRLLTPALTLLIGGSVAFLLISTITAILDLNELAG